MSTPEQIERLAAQNGYAKQPGVESTRPDVHVFFKKDENTDRILKALRAVGIVKT